MVEKVSFHNDSRKLEEYAERSIASKIALGDLNIYPVRAVITDHGR